MTPAQTAAFEKWYQADGIHPGHPQFKARYGYHTDKDLARLGYAAAIAGQEGRDKDAELIAFVQGAKWWEYKKEGATMWQADQEAALVMAEFMRKEGSLGKTVEDWAKEVLSRRDAALADEGGV